MAHPMGNPQGPENHRCCVAGADGGSSATIESGTRLLVRTLVEQKRELEKSNLMVAVRFRCHYSLRGHESGVTGRPGLGGCT